MTRQRSSAQPDHGLPWWSLREWAIAVLRTGLTLGLLIAAYAWAPWDRWNGLAAIGQLLLWSVLVVVALVMEVRAVLRSAHPWIRALQGSMVCAALQLLPFAGIYTAMSEADRATFTQPLTRLDAAYFTVTVFATVGFGDVAPVSAPARALVTVQMLADLILIGVIVKVLVGAAQRRRDLLRPLDPDRLRSQRGPAPGPAAQPGAFPGPDRRSGSVAAGPPVPGEDS